MNFLVNKTKIERKDVIGLVFSFLGILLVVEPNLFL